MTYGSCTLYCSWLCWYLHIPLLIFVCYIQSMKQTWVFVSETNKARSKSKTLVFIPIVLLRAVICLEDFSCLSYLHRLMSPLIVEQWPLMLSQVTSPLMVLHYRLQHCSGHHRSWCVYYLHRLGLLHHRFLSRCFRHCQ